MTAGRNEDRAPAQKLPEVLTAFTAYLTRTGVSPHITRAYLRWLQEFGAFPQQSGRLLKNVLAEEHERAFAARDFRESLKHTRHLAPARVHQALAALHTFCQFQGFASPQVKREDFPQLAPRALSACSMRSIADCAGVAGGL